MLSKDFRLDLKDKRNEANRNLCNRHRENILQYNVCELFPDNQVLIDPYINLFACSNESLTCSVAWLIGSKTDVFVFGGYLFKPKYSNYAVTLAAVRGWRNGKVIMQRVSFDIEQLLSQVSMSCIKK